MWQLLIYCFCHPSLPQLCDIGAGLTLISSLPASNILNFGSRKHWRGMAGRGDFFLILVFSSCSDALQLPTGQREVSCLPALACHDYRNFSDKHWTEATPSLWGLNFIPVGVLPSFFLPWVPSISSRLSPYLLFLLLEFSSPLLVLHSLLPDNLFYWIFKLGKWFLFPTGYWTIYFIHAKYLLIAFAFSKNQLLVLLIFNSLYVLVLYL